MSLQGTPILNFLDRVSDLRSESHGGHRLAGDRVSEELDSNDQQGQAGVAADSDERVLADVGLGLYGLDFFQFEQLVDCGFTLSRPHWTGLDLVVSSIDRDVDARFTLLEQRHPVSSQ